MSTHTASSQTTGPQAAVATIPTARYVAGALFGLASVTIWAGWMSITRLGVTSSLGVYDVTMLRYATAGLVLLPVLLRPGLGLDKAKPWQLLVMIAGAGAPYAVVAGFGLRTTPAGEAGVLIPGVMPLFVALISAVALRERFSMQRKVGYALILASVALIAGVGAVATGLGSGIGHLLCMAGAFMWACYAVALRKSGLGALHAVAVVSVGSALLYLPLYGLLHGFTAFDAPLRDVVFQAVYQGVFATVISLFLFARSVALLGASAGAAFGACVPVMAALMAIPILGEYPSGTDWLGIFAATIGVYLASGGPLPRRG